MNCGINTNTGKLLLLILLLTAASPALAQVHIIQIRQIHPDGPYHTQTCYTDEKFCHVSFPLIAKSKNYLEAIMTFFPEGAVTRFKNNDEYMAVNPEAHIALKIYLRKDVKTVTLVKLYDMKPLASDKNLLVLRHPVPKAELEITISPQSDVR